MRRAALALLLLLGVLGAAEAAARLLDLPQGVLHDAEGRLYQNHPTRFWALQPEVEVTWREGVTVRTNRLGLRDDPVVPDPGRPRVISLGESSTFGDGVPAEATYTERLGARLGVDAVNAGVPGYSLWQSATWFEEEGRHLAPDVVLVYHQHNDLLAAGVVDPKNYLYRVPDTDRALYEARLPWKGVLALAYRSRAYLWVRGLLLRAPTDLPPVTSTPGVRPPRVRVPDDDRRLALGWLARRCAPPDCRLVVLQPTYGLPMPPDTLLADEARRLGLGWVDLPAARRASGLPDDRFYLDLVHPTVEGHRVIADAVAPTLVPLLPYSAKP